MAQLLWSYDQLVRFTKYDDPEVRYWAADRLTCLFPEEAADAIADLILDEHDATPEVVAEHIGRHGGPRHVPALLKGFRHGSDVTPGRCVEALARLGYDATPDLAVTALYRKEISEPCLGIMVRALTEMATARKKPSAADRAREFLLRRPELFAEPAALRGAISLLAPADFADLMRKWITALHFQGAERLESCIRVLLEELQLEDCGWCVRTGRTGRIDLDRTLKAIESGYDIDLEEARSALSSSELSERLQRGAFPEMAASLSAYIKTRLAGLSVPADDSLPARLDGLASAFQIGEVVEMADRLQPATHQWLIGLLVAALVKASSYHNYPMELDAAGDDLDSLLGLAEVETSCLVQTLPERLAAVGDQSGPARGRIIEWCVRTLEARGPFFPKAVALRTLGAMKTLDLIPEIASHLADDNPYIYGSAERALSSMGPAVIDHARAVMRGGSVHPDVMQSLIRISCEQSLEVSLRLLVDNLDEVFEVLGPEISSDLAGLVAHQELLPHLRRWLQRSPAMIGQTLLLVGALHNIPIPEEESILQAIDDYWKGASDGADEGPSGQYLM
ncbi:MAG TPA: hypothetical protein VFG76_11985 [Candidatus Polarisedimenticolia bacterium]|nr:hypothetical protein [Candidatus Polarisedimenticolia bacterium]